MRKYETMIVLNANLAENERADAIATVLGVLTSNGAKILEQIDWGKRELAYEIDNQRYGHYIIATFETINNKAVEEYERLININTNVLRYILINLTK